MNAVEKHVQPLEQEGRDEIDEVLDRIESGDIKEHFDTESLKTVRKAIRSDKEELAIRRWSADNNYNGNEILEAYNEYLPGVSLNDNPKLNAKLQEIEEHLNIRFFETHDFEEAVMAYFIEISGK